MAASHSRIPSEAVANEIAAPAASEAAAPGTGQEYVSVGPTAPGDLPVATPTGSAAAGVQRGPLPSSKTLLSSKIRRSRRGRIPLGESIGGQISHKTSR